MVGDVRDSLVLLAMDPAVRRLQSWNLHPGWRGRTYCHGQYFGSLVTSLLSPVHTQLSSYRKRIVSDLVVLKEVAQYTGTYTCHVVGSL